jgi:hypothetical protein
VENSYHLFGSKSAENVKGGKIMEKVRTAHSNFKKGLSDYHDGYDYLSNSENPLEDGIYKEPQKLDGKEAQGNNHLEDLEPDNGDSVKD